MNFMRLSKKLKALKIRKRMNLMMVTRNINQVLLPVGTYVTVWDTHPDVRLGYFFG